MDDLPEKEYLLDKKTAMAGVLLLIVLFFGSSSFAEEISGSKYPEYARYRQNVSRFFPGRKYKD